METIVIYYSKYGKTRKLVESLSGIDSYSVSCSQPIDLSLYQFFIFLCPTYGDEELPLEMEDFIRNLNLDNKKYCICELGNYFGLDELEWGAKKIIESELTSRNWKEFYKNLSLDSLPKIDKPKFESWKKGLYHKINSHV